MQGWVLSLSLGASCHFFYHQKLEDDPFHVTLNSGDLILFNGGKLFHGVTEIVTSRTEGMSNTDARGIPILPDFWSYCHESDILPRNYMRMNVQFRDQKFMRNFERLAKNDGHRNLDARTPSSRQDCHIGQHSDGKQASVMSAFDRDMKAAMAASLRTLKPFAVSDAVGVDDTRADFSDSEWEG